jgi:hypothetical protein
MFVLAEFISCPILYSGHHWWIMAAIGGIFLWMGLLISLREPFFTTSLLWPEFVIVLLFGLMLIFNCTAGCRELYIWSHGTFCCYLYVLEYFWFTTCTCCYPT